MNQWPQILVFAGPNGSGKSTITASWDTVGIYINADEIKVVEGCSDIEAARQAEQLRELCVAEGRDFTFETVLSTDRNLNLLERAKAAGYRICGVFVLTATAELNVFRVRSRVLAAGHDVPADKIRSRYARTLANIPRLVAICDEFWLVDNTESAVVLYFKDESGSDIYPSLHWSTEEIWRVLNAPESD